MRLKFTSFLSVYLLFHTGVYAQKITFHKDVAPIIQNKCMPCHRPGEAVLSL